MMGLLSRSYFLSKMEQDVEAYVKTCLIFQQDKSDKKKATGLLQPLLIPERLFESISMDFMVGFLKVNGMR